MRGSLYLYGIEEVRIKDEEDSYFSEIRFFEKGDIPTLTVTIPKSSILGIKSNPDTSHVEDVYESLSPGQRAHLFNKLLKHEDYNVHGTNAAKLAAALGRVTEAQS